MIYILFLLFSLLIIFFAYYQWQYFMVFTPTYYREEQLLDGCELLTATTPDGVDLEGALYEPQKPTATLLVFVGRSHDAVGLINKLSLLYPQTRVITFNYRSYGESGGSLSEKSLLSDALFLADLVQKNYGDFYLLGFSLGSNLAAYVSQQRDSKGVFLVGAFDSLKALAKTKFKFVPPPFRYKFDTQSYMQNNNTPAYIFVSKDDEITYIQNARNLQKKSKNIIYYKEFSGLSHKELLWDKNVVTKINEVMK